MNLGLAMKLITASWKVMHEIFGIEHVSSMFVRENEKISSVTSTCRHVHEWVTSIF